MVKYRLGENEVHYRNNITYREIMGYANLVAETVVKLNTETGVVENNVLMCEPVKVFYALSMFSDANLDPYKDEDGVVDLFKVYDDFYPRWDVVMSDTDESIDYDDDTYARGEPVPNCLFRAVSNAISERNARLKQATSVSATIQNVVKALGSVGNKDMSVIRNILTQILISGNKPSQNKPVHDEPTSGIPVDLSAYRVTDKSDNSNNSKSPKNSKK